MIRILKTRLMAFSAAAGLLAPLALGAQDKQTVPPGTPVTITVQPAASTAPPASFTLAARHGHVTPVRHGCTHTGGGNIDIAQPSPDTIVVTMAGAAIAYGALQNASAGMNFDLEQCFEINFDNPKLKKAKLTLEGRVIGLLRTHCPADCASYDQACATIGAGTVGILTLCVPPHSVGGSDNLSVNDHDGPVSVPVQAGKYTLHQTFSISANARAHVVPVKGPSAEFAPDPALDPLWLAYKEPFHGAAKKDFGFQVTIKVAEDTDTNGNDKEKEKEKEEAPAREKLPEPKLEK
jgi:hypothetical protein